jgi:autotransporter-associated beta strand protein
MTSALTVNGTVDLNGSNQQLAGLTGSGSVTNSSGTLATLNIGNGSADTYPGAITGNLALTTSGAGTLTLSSANSYTGATTIGAGTLSVANASALQGTSGVNVTTPAILDIDSVNLTGVPVTLNGTLTGTGTAAFAGTLALGSSASVGGSGVLTISSVISGSNGLTKTGSGTLILSGDSGSYTGTITPTAGLVKVDGSDGNTPVSLAGGSLGGSGTVGSVSQASGSDTIAPGDSPGILTSNANLTLGSATTVALELNGATAGSGYDQLAVNGNVALAGATLNVTLGFTPTVGESFTIVNNHGASPVNGTFAGLSEGQAFSIGDVRLQISYQGGASGNNVTLTRITPPSSVALSSSSSSGSSGAPVTFTATVSPVAPATATPTGTVTFSDGSTVIGSSSLSDGVATLQTSSLGVGTHQITAAYGGDANYAASGSSATAYTVTESSGTGGTGGTGTGGTGGTGGTVTKPAVTSLRQTNATWRESSALPHFSRVSKPPVGTTFSFALNVAATTRLVFTELLPGRRVGGRCIAQTTKNRHKAACKRTVVAGALSLRGHAGTNRLKFAGRLSSTRKLAAGSYRVSVTAKNAGGTSGARSLLFTIAKG